MSKAQALLTWIDERFPLTALWKSHVSEYYAPKNFNFWYYFGSLALLVLVIQIVSGIFLTMNYKPDAHQAFQSVEYIMRDVEGGWLIRYIHSTGASMFFVVIYLHMFRGLLYGSYRKPRELLWLFGVLIYLCLMAEAFFGYLLPWGQMSYWGAQVIVNLFGAIPIVGEDLAVWIRGDYVVSDATLNRFFAFHVIAIPLALLGLVVKHLMALHEVGSSNPDGIEIKKHKDASGKPLDGIPFHPYYIIKDTVGVVVFLAVFSFIVFFTPEMGGYFLEYNNFIPADPLKTPLHIAPVWYFTPYYAMLRAVPAFLQTQFWGVAVMGAAVLIFFFLPWLDRSPVKSIRYKGPYYKIALTLFVMSFLILGWLGTEPTDFLGSVGKTEVAVILARLFTLVYFAFFLAMPWYSRVTKPVPTGFRLRTRQSPKAQTPNALAPLFATGSPFALPRARRWARPCATPKMHVDPAAHGIRQLLPQLPQRENMRYSALGISDGHADRDNLMFATALSARPSVAADTQGLVRVAAGLTVIRGTRADFTYLRSFYRDDSTIPAVTPRSRVWAALPHVLYELQGVQT
jgi:ubiquinol-cytochrome c reductase cytochrome b subunit